MRYAAAYKPDSEPLDQFVRRKGGINVCAARFARHLGRGRAMRFQKRSAKRVMAISRRSGQVGYYRHGDPHRVEPHPLSRMADKSRPLC